MKFSTPFLYIWKNCIPRMEININKKRSIDQWCWCDDSNNNQENRWHNEIVKCLVQSKLYCLNWLFVCVCACVCDSIIRVQIYERWTNLRQFPKHWLISSSLIDMFDLHFKVHTCVIYIYIYTNTPKTKDQPFSVFD